MTTIDEVLGTCERVVQFRRYGGVIKLVGPCKDCTGYKSEAIRKNCNMYHPYLQREGLKRDGTQTNKIR